MKEWNEKPGNTPIGSILSLEGADSIQKLSGLEKSWKQGLRALGPAHYGKGRYALGHDQEGPLPAVGKDLLKEMDRLGLILDMTHLCTGNFWNALEIFQGPLWASHHNCRALVDDPRQLDDEQIKALAERGAVIGAAFDVWMVAPGWERGKTEHPNHPGANLEGLANHVDHVCQLLGTSRHCGIGTDLDGGFGNEQSPSDMDTINDLLKFKTILEKSRHSQNNHDGGQKSKPVEHQPNQQPKLHRTIDQESPSFYCHSITLLLSIRKLRLCNRRRYQQIR